MKTREHWIRFRIISWVGWRYPFFRRNVYDNKWEHLEFIYFGKLNLLFGWMKNV